MVLIDYLFYRKMQSILLESSVDPQFSDLTRLHKDNMRIESENEATFDCSDNILETICSLQNIVALRTMNKVVLLKITEVDSHLYFDKIKLFESEIAFTSISFDKHHTNILYATRLDGNLSIVNLDRMTSRSVKLKRTSNSNENNWNSVIGGERGTYMHVEKSAISFYDKRTNGVINTWSGVGKIVDEIHCNDITAAMRCDDSPSLYFTTDHHLFLMDTRCSNRTHLKALQRWTHGLRCLPTYMSVGKSENNKEFIVLSSQWCQDTCVVSNYADSVIQCGNIPGVSMPFHLPHVMDTLSAARMQLLCLDLSNPIEGRLATSITGQIATDQGENFAILTQNSLGDVTLRTLYPHYMKSFVEDNSVQKLSDWSKSYTTERKEFEVSSIPDIANVLKKLKRVPEGYNFGPNNKEEVFNESEIYDAFEKEELIPELLDAWVEERNDETVGQDSSLALNLHYDDSYDEE